MGSTMKTLLSWICNQAISTGRIEVATASGERFVAGGGTGQPEIAIRFMDKAAERSLLLHPEMALGELITDGRLVIERGTMYDFLELLMRGKAGGRGVLGSRFVRRLRRAAQWVTGRNGERRARANVAHHYDLDHHLYDLFLDEDRNYSCAYFEHPGQSLEEAQLAKKRHVTAKLLLEPGQDVLDIGCGWGGLALYLADVAGAGRVTGVTLSKEQHEMAGARAQAQGLGDRVQLDLCDYRRVQGEFDRIVSVGMFEHVGRLNYGEFFETSARLLREDGVMLLHTIGWTGAPSPVNPWIAKYIFPGGHIPTLDEMLPAIQEAGLHVTDIEVLRLHYADTLRAWRERFMARRDEAVRLYDERFCRMWEFYLAASEAGFRHDRMVVFQVQLARRIDAVPMTRNYIEARERELRALEGGMRMPAATVLGKTAAE
jgi:cyclopropane-fatty-acyl-phospholipid synthase